MWIRNNKVGPGRLMFVAGHGAGNASDVYIQDNVLNGHYMGVDFVAPGGDTTAEHRAHRQRQSNAAEGNGRGTMVRFVGYDYIDVRNNTLVAQPGRDMVMAGLQRSCAVTVSGNDLGPNGVGQIKYLDETPYVCGTVPPLVKPTTPNVVRRASTSRSTSAAPAPGMIPCPTTTNCGGYYTGGAATPLRASSSGDRRAEHDAARRSAFRHPDSQWCVPAHAHLRRTRRSTSATRRFHVDIDDRIRLESSFDVNKEAGGKNKLVTHTYNVVVGDGVMDLDFEPGGTGANAPILSMIEIDRAGK